LFVGFRPAPPRRKLYALADLGSRNRDKIGTLAGAKLPEGMRATAMQAIGIVTLLVGVANFLELATTPTQVVPTLTVVAVR
jgi:hypothetical protein